MTRPRSVHHRVSARRLTRLAGYLNGQGQGNRRAVREEAPRRACAPPPRLVARRLEPRGTAESGTETKLQRVVGQLELEGGPYGPLLVQASFRADPRFVAPWRTMGSALQLQLPHYPARGLA